MQIRVVSHRDEIPSLSPREFIIHLAFRPTNVDILNLVSACPKIEAVQVPPSYIGSVSRFSIMYLGARRIQLIEGTVWGHRKDLCDYYTIPSLVTTRIQEMRGFGVASEAIGEKLKNEFRMDAGMIGFLVNKT